MGTGERRRGPDDLVASVLACPDCRTPFEVPDGRQLRCTGAGHVFPVTDGIPQLLPLGEGSDWKASSPPVTSEAYARQYEDADEAARYNAMYDSRASKRVTTRRESRLIQRHFRSQPPCGTVLDLPCGGGRLTRAILEAAPEATVLEADIGLGQVKYARDQGLGGDRQFFMTASGFHIPIRDGGVDAVVCCRLLHHLPAAEEQERLIAEVLRVARRFAVVTFFDFYSVKNTLRRLRAPFNRKPPKITMKPDRLREMAGMHGADVAAMPHLFYVSSGHRYALLVKNDAGA